jgi:N-acyl-phosphatidylethanolamine-hydrolysing phospholipase D
MRWAIQRRRQKSAITPPRGSFPTAIPEIVRPRRADSELAATWIGHSTVLLQFGGLNILTDPIFSARASPVSWAGPRRVMDPAISLEQLPSLDMVLLSHNHYDHLDASSTKWIARHQPHAVWFVPLGLGRTMRAWGAATIIELDWWQSAIVNGCRVTATPARHFSARGFSDRNRTLWCGFAFEVGGKRAYFAGDTAYHPQFAEIGARCGPFDFAMIPIGAYDPRWFMHVVHADPEEAVQIYQDLISTHRDKPHPLMLGIHWGTFRLTDEPMSEPPERLAAKWRDTGLDPETLWTAKFGETRRIR